MELSGFFDSFWFEWVLIPVLICLARIVDVSIGTLRIIFVSKGMRVLAPVLGFFEVIIWLVAIGQIFQNLSNWVNYIAYGAGFAMGNFVGIYIEGKISLGYTLVRIITRRSATQLKEYLRESRYRFTMVDGVSDWGKVSIIYMPLRRRDVPEVIGMVKRYNPKAFYTVEEVKSVSGDVFRESDIRSYRHDRMIPRTKKK